MPSKVFAGGRQNSAMVDTAPSVERASWLMTSHDWVISFKRCWHWRAGSKSLSMARSSRFAVEKSVQPLASSVAAAAAGALGQVPAAAAAASSSFSRTIGSLSDATSELPRAVGCSSLVSAFFSRASSSTNCCTKIGNPEETCRPDLMVEEGTGSTKSPVGAIAFAALPVSDSSFAISRMLLLLHARTSTRTAYLPLPQINSVQNNVIQDSKFINKRFRINRT